MNDLMTRSFLSYVELKKQAMKDLEAEPDIEMGQLNPVDEKNLSQFFEEVGAIKADMEEITNLLLDLKDLNEDTKSIHSAKILRGVRDRINSDMVTILRKAKIIKGRLELLDTSNAENRGVSDAYKAGSPVERTRVSVTNGLRMKLRDLMNEFQGLRERIVADHREGLKRRYYSATGEEPSEELLEKMITGNAKERVFEGKADLLLENQERHEALKEIQKSLTELHQVFLDMAVMIDNQGDQINNIEQNVANAKSFITGGAKDLNRAKKLKKRSTLACWVSVVVLVFVLVCLMAILF
ncbi:syntaxin-112-like [Coffea eugenioides]|uniref:syntaxin-112-like n=1 Tax=Coffea eugenioides TaxID=49369 RepID=UPI000F61519C|nr:syntaxin-112-like [Coffea eugenioides]XP_027162041.1 syntaxin-112-like [Coffea eugenioides]